MLRCIFGKCSSGNYVVNELPKESRKSVKPVNGVSKISSLPSDPPLTTTDRTPNNQISTSTQSRLQKNEHANSDMPIQISSQNELHRNSETKANKPGMDNGITGTSLISKTKTQAPQPIKKQVTAVKENNVSISKSTVRKNENHEIIELDKKESIKDGQVLDSEKQVTAVKENNVSISKSTVTKNGNQEIIELDKKESIKDGQVLDSEQTSTKDMKNNEEPVVKKQVLAVIENNALASETKIVKEETENIIVAEEEDFSEKPETIDTSKPTSTSNIKKDEKSKNDKRKVRIDLKEELIVINGENPQQNRTDEDNTDSEEQPVRRRSGIVPSPVKYDAALPNYPKDPDDEALIKKAIENNDFLSKIISGKRLEDVIQCMYNKEVSAKETIIKQGEKGSHMYVSAKGTFQVVVKGKVVNEFNDVRVFGELAILYNAKRLATIKALTSGRVWALDRGVYQQIMHQYNIKEQDEILEFLMNNNKLNKVRKEALQEVANLLKSEFFASGKQIVRQGDKGYKFYIIRAGTVTITKDGEGVVGNCKKGDCFGELALLKEDCRQATVTADPPGVECLTLTRKEFIEHFGELDDFIDIDVRPPDSIKEVVAEHEDIDLTDLKIIKTLGVGGFGRVELVQHTKHKNLVFAIKYLKKIDIVMQHQQEHVYNEKNIQMASRSPFIVRLYRTYKDTKYIYLLMESCLGGDLWSLLQKQKSRRFDEKEARFIAACVLESFDYLHSRGIIYRDLKPENLLIASNGYIKLTDFGFAKKISSRGKTFTFAGTPEYVAPEIVLNKGHDRAVDYWAFGAFIFELLTGRTPFRTDDSSHMKTYNKILNGIDNVQFPTYVNLKARHIIEKLCRPIPSERLGMQRGGIKDIKTHKWFLGFDWQKFAKCELSSPFKPKLKSPVDTQYFDQFKKDLDIPPDEESGWDVKF